MRGYLCISFCLIGSLLGGPAFPETDPHGPAHAEEVTQAQPEPAAGEDWQVPAQMLYQAPGTARSFIDERRAIQNALAASLSKASAQWGMSAETSDNLLALARLHYRHAQGPEGLSVLEGLDRANLSATQEMRRAVLELALGLIDPRDIGLTPRAQALLGPAYAAWPDQQLFLALQSVRQRRFDDAADLLADVRDRMDRLPETYQEVVLPGLLEAAIATENWRVARDFALAFRKHAALRNSGAFHYLLGRAAEAGQDLLAAFDSYTLASAEHSLFGHRARTAIVSMGLRHELLSIHEARNILDRETHLWRGDDYALAVLTDLAALDRADGDRVGAVRTYGSILDRFPERQEAGLARQKARALIAEIYADGASGDLGLADFLIAHRKIAPDFRFEPGFDAQGEKFADRFLAVGSTLVAAQEYQAVHDHLAVARDLGLADVNDRRLDELLLKQVTSLELGGQYDEALTALREPLASGDPDLEDRRSELLAKLYASTGQSAAVLETSIANPDVNFLRLKARAYFDREDWAASQAIYQQMWDQVGQELPFEDAIGLLLSSYRSGDLTTTMTLSREFPELTSIPQWSTIAAGLTDPAAQLWPLREDTARMRMDSATQALENVQQVAPGTN